MTGAGRRQPARDDSGKQANWMLTFNDLMMLLLTFFVLLLAFSTLQPQKASQAAASAVSALGAERMGGNALEWFIRPFVDRDIEAHKSRQGATRPGDIVRDRQAVVAQALATIPGARLDAAVGGFAARLPLPGLFEGDTLRLGPVLKGVLDRLADVSRGGGARVVVAVAAVHEMNGPEESRGERRRRSILRSDAVARYLHEAGGVPAERISVGWVRTPGGETDRQPDPAAGEIRLDVAFPG